MAKKSFWNKEKNFIYTSNLIEISKVIKGTCKTDKLEIITNGGEIDLTKIVTEPALQLSAEETGVFLLHSNGCTSQFGYPVFETYADQQGFIKFDLSTDVARDPFNTYTSINNDLYNKLEALLNTSISDFVNPTHSGKLNSNASIAAAITGFSPSSITAGTYSVITITGSGFGSTQNASNFVEFRNADDGGATFIQPHSTQYLSWTNTQIQVMVPTRASTVCGTAGTGQIRLTVAGSPTLSANTLTVTHGQINVYSASNNTIVNTRHVDLNTQGGITWQMFTGFNSNAAAKASFIRALNTWRCNTNINWPLGAPTSINTIALDNVCVARFDIGSELPVGVLGRCTSYFSGCISGPSTFFYISELDIVFDDATTWQFGPANATGSQYDFESVALHELGHGHQLSHVIASADVMHYSIANAVNKRTLVANNLTGGNAVMTRNLSGGVCAKSAMTAIAPSTCSLTAPSASFNVTSPICVNQLLTLTNLSSGSPTSYTWTMTGGSPTGANTQNTSVSYATAGTKTISLQVENGIGASTVLSKTVNVLSSPVISVGSASTCAGTPVVLTASGSTTSYTWTPGNLTGATQTLNPASTTVYNVVGSNGTCTNSANGTVSVTSLPNITVSNANICAGTATLLTASGANTYTWNPGNLTGASQNLNPSSTTIYTITGANPCINTKTVSVTVNNCTSVLQNSTDNFLRIFPNPTKGIISIESAVNMNGTITISNALGQLISSSVIENTTNYTIDLSSQPNGVYLLKYKTLEGNERSIKLIKE